MSRGADTTPKPATPQVRWHRRIVQALLYGRNVNRDKKAKARLGLAIVAFATIYLVIGARLVLYAVAPDAHVARRVGSGDRVATSRPDILDRKGEVLASDVMTPSLFAEPKRIIDPDEASELLTAVIPDLDGTDLRERLSSKRGFVWLRREITPKQQKEVHPPGTAGRRLPDREQARLSKQRRNLSRRRPRQCRQPGHCRHREVARRPRPCRPAPWPALPPTTTRSR